MTKTQPSPTTSQPNRYRGPAWALAAFVVTLTLGGLYFAFSGDDGQVVGQTAVPTPTTVLTPAPDRIRLPELGQEPIKLDPGVYFVDVDGDPSTTAGGTLVIESPGWIGSEAGIQRQNGVGLHVHQVEQRLDAAYPPGCDWGGGPTPMVARWTAADLADGFAAGGFIVREAPALVSAFGHDGYHVVVEVPEGCSDALGGQYNIFLSPGDVVEAWLFDMDGHIVMVEAFWRADSPGITESSEEDLAELRAVIDSLVLTP